MAVTFKTLIQNATPEADQSRILGVIGTENLQRRKNWIEEAKRQTHEHKKRMFDMVHWMTIVTYVTVLIVVITQLFDFKFPSSFGDLFCLRWIDAEAVSTEKLGIILTGFLAELLLLPKIILNGLFNGKTNEKQD